MLVSELILYLYVQDFLLLVFVYVDLRIEIKCTPKIDIDGLFFINVFTKPMPLYLLTLLNSSFFMLMLSRIKF